MFWLLTFLLPLISAQYRIEPLNIGGGLHYEYQNKLGFMVNSWQFVVNVNYEQLRQRVDQLRNFTQVIHNELKGDLINCSNIYERHVDYLMTRRLQNLYENHNSVVYTIKHKKLNSQPRVHPHHYKRHKRNLLGGAFNFVSRGYKYLFGFMDDRDAELLYQVAKHANSTQYRVVRLTTQTLKISQYLDRVKNLIESSIISCQFVAHQLDYLRDNFDEIETIYAKILDALKLALHNNKLSNYIIDPLILIDEMKVIDDPESEWIVSPNKDNIHLILQLIKCHVFLNSDNELMFVVQIPRIDKTQFDLYKVISIPECDTSNVCKFVTTQSQYIGFASKQYVRLDDVSTCSALDFITLCDSSVTSNFIGVAKECDVKLFHDSGRHHHKCDVRATKFVPELFHSLNNLNSWLYMVSVPTNLRINCATGAYNHNLMLNGTGILTVWEFCKLKTTNTILVSKHIGTDEEAARKIIYYNLTMFRMPPAEKYHHQRAMSTLNFDSLNDVTKNLQQLITTDEPPLEFSEPDKNENADWYLHIFDGLWWELKIILVIFLILLALYIRRTFCTNSGSRQQTTILPIFKPS
ncbi:efp [Hyphantria cunea granulovirus]|uniref:Efp n=1 Tax=Hyphantria cunea granulovirus TaxID=307448 RepID=A0AAE6D0I3_9BBAC|nr:efp [Hyphantria cunea granulovirus]QBQ01579.1 efp [Hyphantria cunea granulovirus]